MPVTFNDQCKNYFNGFNEVWNWKKEDRLTIALAVGKIVTYVLIIPPVAVFCVLAVSTLMGRIKHLNDSNNRKISDIADTNLLKKSSNQVKKENKLSAEAVEQVVNNEPSSNENDEDSFEETQEVNMVLALKIQKNLSKKGEHLFRNHKEINDILFSPYFLNAPCLCIMLLVMTGTEKSGINAFQRGHLHIEMHERFSDYATVKKALRPLINRLYSEKTPLDQKCLEDAKKWLENSKEEFEKFGLSLREAAEKQNHEKLKPPEIIKFDTDLKELFQGLFRIENTREIEKEGLIFSSRILKQGLEILKEKSTSIPQNTYLNRGYKREY